MKACGNVALWVSGLTSSTSTTPAALALVTAVAVVGLVTVTAKAGTPPRRIEAPGSKYWPVRVISVFPCTGPCVGEMLVMLGAATYRKPPVRVANCASVLVTVTSASPAVPVGVIAVS